MSNGIVKFQVERRPMKSDGTVFRGLKAGDYITAGTEVQKGEPWIVHSTHHSLPSALDSATPLAMAIASENIRIVKVISGATKFDI